MDGLDFFAVLEEEINKINKFYLSKLTGRRRLSSHPPLS